MHHKHEMKGTVANLSSNCITQIRHVDIRGVNGINVFSMFACMLNCLAYSPPNYAAFLFFIMALFCAILFM